MAGRDDERTPGFNAPLPDSGPIVSKRTGPRRARVQGALGAPQKMMPLGRGANRGADSSEDVDLLDDLEVGTARSPFRGIAITLLILLVLGTRGCGLLSSSDSDEPQVPPSTTEPPLVQRLPGPPETTIVARDDNSPDD